MNSSSETRWLIGPSRPIVPTTAVTPSSSGTPAATSAPKVSTRMISVTGIDSMPALREVVAEGLAERLVGAGVAELADEQSTGAWRRRP